MGEPYYDLPKPLRVIRSLRDPAKVFSNVPNTIRQSAANVVQDLYQENQALLKRQKDTEWLQEAAFQILKENNLMPSSSELIAARERAHREREAECAPSSSSD